MLSGNTYHDGMKVLALPLTRKSQKKIDMIADRMKPAVEKIGKMWDAKEFSSIATLVNEVSA